MGINTHMLPHMQQTCTHVHAYTHYLYAYNPGLHTDSHRDTIYVVHICSDTLALAPPPVTQGVSDQTSLPPHVKVLSSHSV